MEMKFKDLKLEKGMYQVAGKSFSAVLESEDPSENYKGTSMEGMDAFQRQLKRFNIRVKGGGCDRVEKFFQSAQSAVLFPEYVARSVRQGMEDSDLLPNIVAAVTTIDGTDYRAISSISEKEMTEMRRVEEGASIPQTTVITQENLVRLHKRGRMLVASYEAIRYQRLDLFSVTLHQIGAQISRTLLDDAIEVLELGDGNQNPAELIGIADPRIGGKLNTLTYNDLVSFWAQFDPYEMKTLLVSGDVMLKLLKMPEFRDPMSGMNFQATGKLITPMGATLLRTNMLGEGKMIGLDKRYALEMVKSADVTVEYDKLIDRQLERAAITTVVGFAKIFADAAKVMSVTGK